MRLTNEQIRSMLDKRKTFHIIRIETCDALDAIEALLQENEQFLTALKQARDVLFEYVDCLCHGGMTCPRCRQISEIDKVLGGKEEANRLAAYEDSQMIPEEVLKQKDENYLLRGVLKGINQCIGHAMIELEQGGKYDWNSDLEACNNWLKEAKEIIIETVKALERGV